ncbi:hypothetical protein ZHAS_00010623 [Anopheles sinensis]|uniref:Uncharacterized protein n=1 Tax=Anopheles sinensis TaxID=74873 RepID=A0A084VY25_ANOSI|nr:hypothetical protein ZHAS_00010623 [Anopheles sinensis]
MGRGKTNTSAPVEIQPVCPETPRGAPCQCAERCDAPVFTGTPARRQVAVKL